MAGVEEFCVEGDQICLFVKSRSSMSIAQAGRKFWWEAGNIGEEECRVWFQQDQQCPESRVRNHPP